MGGMGPYTSTPAGPNIKNYFLSQPFDYDFGGTNMWGYAWVKFDTLSPTTVDSAYLVYDLLGVGGMQVMDATPANPGNLYLYSPGETDVNDLGDGALRGALRDQLMNDAPLYGELVMPANGTYSVDITDIYNGWVDGSITNNGLVLVSDSECSSGAVGNVGTKYASFGNPYGNSLYVSDSVVGTLAVPVPEPASMALLACGIGGMLMRRNRHKA
jgi:hypothetical protein